MMIKCPSIHDLFLVFNLCLERELVFSLLHKVYNVHRLPTFTHEIILRVYNYHSSCLFCPSFYQEIHYFLFAHSQ